MSVKVRLTLTIDDTISYNYIVFSAECAEWNVTGVK